MSACIHRVHTRHLVAVFFDDETEREPSGFQAELRIFAQQLARGAALGLWIGAAGTGEVNDEIEKTSVFGSDKPPTWLTG
jgi:hypothetical protein